MSTTHRTPAASSNRLSSHPHPHPSSTTSTTSTSAQKSRQLAHLQSQLAQLTAHMSDLESILQMTAVHAQGMQGLGGYAGGMFMAASKVLGEETVEGAGHGAGVEGQGKGGEGGK